MSMSLFTSRIASLTRSVGRVALHQTPTPATVTPTAFSVARRVVLPALTIASAHLCVQFRSFGAKDKKKKAKNADKAQEKARVNLEDVSVSQHKEWVKFQQAISVDGFETGATTTLQSTKKIRGGKGRSRTKRFKMAEKLKERQRMIDIEGGEFPPRRYSEEETERLLARAYAAIPPSAGPRNSRKKRRAKRRWFLVRRIRMKYKANMAAYQIRKMQTRSKKIKDVKAVLAQAPEICQRDREYQLYVYQQWAARVLNNQNIDQQVQDMVAARAGVAEGDSTPKEEEGKAHI